MSALPPYSVRVSHRARRMQLKVVPPGRIEVVVPRRGGISGVPAFVAEHSLWLQRTLEKVQNQFADHQVLPQSIVFSALEDCWAVEYQDSLRPRLKVLPGFVLQVQAADDQQRKALLQQWLQAHAKQQLAPWLKEVSEETGLLYRGLSVRAQKTRWGSCSARGNISLNRALLFLEPMTVRYLLIHELCHTVHMNHSPAYWRLVAQHMPDYQQYDRQLRHAMRSIPAWALF